MGNWIKEAFDSNENIIYVNYERGEGVTTGILKEILKRDYKNILIDKRYSVNTIKEIYSNLTKKTVLKENLTEGCIVLENNNGNEVKVYCCDLDDNIRGRRVDLIVIDSTRYTIPVNALSFACKIICVLPERVKVINSDKKLGKIIKNNKLNRCQLVEDEIDRLLQELSIIEQNSNTTMTRERLVSMISKMVGIRTGLIENKAGGNIG